MKPIRDVLRISGGIRLHGTVAASGAKNAALPIMAASILCDGPSVLSRVPRVTDVATLSRILQTLGVDAERDCQGRLTLNPVNPLSVRAPAHLVRRMRASFCVLGPLVARRGRAVVPLPGGCEIGERPVDLHLAGLEALGADLRIERGHVVAEAARLRGARVYLRGPSGSTVTGTANVLCAATLARGTTIITGAATEPEIVDLGHFLVAAGAQIRGLGTDTIEVAGVESLAGVEHEVIPDRIEAGTLLLAAAITQGTVSVTGVRPEHLTAVIDALTAAGADVACGTDKITAHAGARLRPVELIARPYPGIPTDLQAQFMALLALAGGRSAIADDVFPQRTRHIGELIKFGARISRSQRLAMVEGVHRLTAAEATASDLRASAALVLAGLAAAGESTIRDVYHLDRGYEGLEQKLLQLGARICRETTDSPQRAPRDAEVGAGASEFATS